MGWVLCSNEVKSSYIAFHKHFNYIVMHFRCVLYMLTCCVLVDLNSIEPMMYLHLHIICSCIFMHTYLHFSYILIYYYVGTFLIVSLSLFLFCVSMLLWHLNKNLLHPRTLCILGHFLPLTLHHLLFDSVMRTPEKTSSSMPCRSVRLF